MADIPKVQRIRQTDLARGAKVERSEHPWAKGPVATRIAKDHLESDPDYYKSGGGRTESVVILNQNVRATAPRKKKKVVAQPIDNGPSWIPGNLRLYG